MPSVAVQAPTVQAASELQLSDVPIGAPPVTKRERQLILRHAAIAVLARLTLEPQFPWSSISTTEDDDSDRWNALRVWHGEGTNHPGAAKAEDGR